MGEGFISMLWLLAALLFIVALYLFMIAPAASRPDASRFADRLYAHRGLHDGNRDVPENSMQAFRLALEAGYGIELDVQLTRDEKLVVHHDATLARVCGVDKRIAELTWAELSEIRLPNGEGVPLFSDVLALTDGAQPLLVEVKYHFNVRRTAEETLKALRGYAGDYCVESFHPVAVRYFRKHAPGVLCGQLAGGGKWKRGGDGLRFEQLALKYLLVNAVSRPHFVAYSCAVDRNVSMWLMKHFFKPLLAGYTIRTQEGLDRALAEGYRMPIFELFTPKAQDGGAR